MHTRQPDTPLQCPHSPNPDIESYTLHILNRIPLVHDTSDPLRRREPPALIPQPIRVSVEISLDDEGQLELFESMWRTQKTFAHFPIERALQPSATSETLDLDMEICLLETLHIASGMICWKIMTKYMEEAAASYRVRCDGKVAHIPPQYRVRRAVVDIPGIARRRQLLQHILAGEELTRQILCELDPDCVRRSTWARGRLRWSSVMARAMRRVLRDCESGRGPEDVAASGQTT